MTAAGDWTGKVGDVWAREWRRTERSFSYLAPQLTRAILAVAPEQGQFLDLGCGVGSTSADVAQARPLASVAGVDLSEPMVAIARERHALPNLCFLSGDALTLDVPPLGLIFSRHGVMFFGDPQAAFGHLRRRAVAGAPLVFSCFRARGENRWVDELDRAIGAPGCEGASYSPGPFAFADSAFVADMLAHAGWEVVTVERADFDYVAGEGASDEDALADALDFFERIGPAAAAIRAAAGDARRDLLERIGGRLARYAVSGRVEIPASAWIWTARAAGEHA
ncbi:Methyltransferase domain-containing protein [Sphingomonas palmae]|uniref:Methyltransferase domain-containing protein n=1 Tax=Sphingomonas palmae TaxID=1855283 RepID=A0A1H7FSE8_9SPHN|nr:class I SAM-dependent methyltransferase [Sphingomonas palmae]SEK28879.1 Methyltransferase domain-containing protein [Sphingomonas palmae]